jgi:secretion/DNA translocation related CpaE-like protein
VCTADAEILDHVLRACAAAGVTPDVVEDPGAQRRAWAAAPLVLVGSDQATSLASLGLGRRDGVYVLANVTADAADWRLGVLLGAHHVLTLPDDTQQLLDRLCDLAEVDVVGVIVGVMGACGGAGASTLAAGLALTASRSGTSAILVDADALGGGVQLLLGCEDAPGLRWPDLASTQGRVGASALRAALPTADTLPVLSWDASGSRPIAAGVLRGLAASARRGAELVVIDLPRHLDTTATELLRGCDRVVVVVPSQVRAVAAARSLMLGLPALCPDVRVVVRRLPHTDLTPDSVADALERPLAGIVSTHRSVARAIDEGLGPLGHGRLERTCRTLLAAVGRRT